MHAGLIRHAKQPQSDRQLTIGKVLLSHGSALHCNSITEMVLTVYAAHWSIQEAYMLRYAVIFFIIALVAALFGFGGIAAGATEIAKILFFVFIIIAVVTFVINLIQRK